MHSTAEIGATVDASTNTDQFAFSIFGTDPPNNDTGNLSDRTLRTGGVFLNVNANVGDVILDIPASLGLAQGDILRLSSSDLFNQARPVYFAGELCEVLSVTGDLVTLVHQIYDSYTAVNTLVFKLLMPKVSISDLTILRDSNDIGLNIWECRDIEVNNIKCSGARFTNFQIAYIYSGLISRYQCTDSFFLGSGNSYGLAITTSQNITVQASYITGGRHAIETGGFEPNRAISYDNNTIATLHGEGDGALDVHGNAEFISITNNKIIGGLNITSTNMIIDGNHIFDRGGTAGPVGGDEVSMRFNVEMDSEYTTITNNQIFSFGQGPGGSIENRGQFNIALLFFEPNVTLQLVDISHNKIQSIIGFEHGAIDVRPFLSTGTGGAIDKLMLIENDVTVLSGSSNVSHSVFISDGAFGATHEVRIGEMVISGGSYRTFDGRCMEINPETNSSTLTIENTLLRFDTGCLFTPITTGNFTNATFHNSRFIRSTSGSAALDLFGHSGTVIFTDNWLENMISSSGLDIRNNATAVIRNNHFQNTSGAISVGGQVFSSENGAAFQNRQTWGTAAPVANTWKVGDITWQTTPVAGGKIGFVCTTAGTPGTWKAFGVIDP